MPEAEHPQHPLLEQVAAFAATHIAPYRTDLITSPTFPPNLWTAFGESGFAGLSLAPEFGGAGADYQTLSKAGGLLNRRGGVPGVTMTFMAHWIMTKLHFSETPPLEQARTLLPKFVAGTSTVSVAISEPGAGAHPKLMKATARQDGDDFILNGEKAFLTNGPLADHFLVVAMTDLVDGIKQFSAFLVPAETAGLRRTDGVKIDFLHPCQHGGIVLEDVRVPASALIGKKGTALNDISLRMRAIEDAVGAASHVGSLAKLLTEIAPEAPEDQAARIGTLAVQEQALSVLAAHLARQADDPALDIHRLMELQLGFRHQLTAALADLGNLLEQVEGPLPDGTNLHMRDVKKISGIAASAREARLAKIGKRLQSA
ncbi:acyl-CoA dehydrogenase family protein [Sneathiella chinensis]|uniref:Acyl-CoA dehydrogenase n=1 Tax=Sneathiella chinensis TaxID=349750 RepID=A0ABQ5U151_9PROT|nr:acyl-CoA dehydrogenase family protein [Sneathiella chinensis]GLQ05558.1 hypothetical protein GCM10007924_07790 [Sneathiella chinensis]